MSDQQVSPPKTTGVSPARRAVSTVLLVVALVILGIELRAGLGQSNSGKAMSAMLTEGVFENVPLTTAQAALALWPSESVLRDDKLEKVVRYSWFSLLRPLTGKPQPELFLVSDKSDPPRAITFYTDPEDAAAGFFGGTLPTPGEGVGQFPPPEDRAAGGPGGEGGGRRRRGPGGGGGDGSGGGGGRGDGSGGGSGARSRPAAEDEPAAAEPAATQPAADAPTSAAPAADVAPADAPASGAASEAAKPDTDAAPAP